MKALKKILLIVLSVATGILTAQQDAMFTHYMNNTIAVNPGYAGTSEALSLTALHRSQWVNFEGAPTTQTITMHAPLKNNKMGLGISVINDKIGPVNTTGAYVDYSYMLKLNEKSKLSFGLSAGINYMQAGLANLRLIQQNDIAFQEDVNSKLLPNFGFGMYYYTKCFYAGISSPKLLENNFNNNTIDGTTKLATEKRHYFFIAGGVMRLNSEVEFRPTTFVKATMGAPIEADITASFILNKRVLIGGMYRTGDAIGLLAGYYITNQFHVGYSFDWSYGNRTFLYNQGSHEIMLTYDFIFNDKQKVRSPRYF
jgi:type IX secretion system PorP/SprF family membrane protein